MFQQVYYGCFDLTLSWYSTHCYEITMRDAYSEPDGSCFWLLLTEAHALEKYLLWKSSDSNLLL